MKKHFYRITYFFQRKNGSYGVSSVTYINHKPLDFGSDFLEAENFIIENRDLSAIAILSVFKLKGTVRYKNREAMK